MQYLFSSRLKMDHGIAVAFIISGDGLKTVYSHDDVFQRMFVRAKFCMFRARIDDNDVAYADGNRFPSKA